MKLFFTIVSLVLLSILSMNSLFLILFEEKIFNLNLNEKFLILMGIAIVETVILSIFIKKFFHEPIINLEYSIKSFLLGKLKNQDIIALEKSLNPHINYISSFFSKTLNTLKSIKTEFLHGKEIKGEVELGREIQGKILSKKQINIPSLEVVVGSKPAAEIGGDSHDIIKEKDNYYIYVGDATGHGVGAGFIMMMVNALISGFSELFVSGADILGLTNKVLKPRVKANLLMTILLLRWNEKDKTMFMTGAGHEYLIVYKHAQKKCIKIKSGGVALGMIGDINSMIKDQEIKLEQNDIVVLYSDGITEAINKPIKDGSEEMFGEDRLMNAIVNAPNGKGGDTKTAKGVFNNITIELSQFMGYKHTQLDDITLSIIWYRGETYDISAANEIDSTNEFITEWNW